MIAVFIKCTCCTSPILGSTSLRPLVFPLFFNLVAYCLMSVGLVRYVSLLAALVQAVVVSTFAVSHREHGTTKDFDFAVTYQPYGPDCFSRNMLLVSGQSPVDAGPTVPQ